MRQFLWIGNYENKEKLLEMVLKGYHSSSSQVSQENLIHGLEETGNCRFDIISGSVLPPYPQYKDFIVKSTQWSHGTNAADISVGYINIKYYNRVSCQKAMVKAAAKWAKMHDNINDEIIVLAYSMRSPVMAAACKIKEIIPMAKLVLIITDLPEFMDLAAGKIKKMLKKIDAKQQAKYLAQFDGFVLYAKKMAQYLNLEKRRWMLMEGTISREECEKAQKMPITCTNSEIIVMYCGKVAMNYGIPELLNAFSRIPDEQYKLWITGSGDADSLVLNAGKKDKRIKHYGFLKTRNDLIELQRRATMFVSMRMPTEEASKYCFPSKIFEYMITGKPVLSFDIDGIPEEYWQYLIKMKSIDPFDIAETIIKVGSMTTEERMEYGKIAKEFIINNKNNVIQAQKIWEFITTL